MNSNQDNSDSREADNDAEDAAPGRAAGDGAGDGSGDGALDDSGGDIGHAAGVGATLRVAREARRLTLEHVAAQTRIPIRHLETIEAGEFDALPSRTYAIGFARSYAKAVELDEGAIATRVREELGTARPRYSSITADMEPGDPAKLPSSGLAWFAGIAALILVVGVISFASTYFGAGVGPASLLAGAGAGAGAERDAETGAQAQTDAADASGAAAEDSAAPGAPDATGEVVFTAREDGVWVRFYEEGGERLFEAQMQSGERFVLPADARDPRINTGRPDAFSITVGGRDVPPLATEPVTMGGEPVSAAALLARKAP